MKPKQRCLLAVLLIALVCSLATSTAQGQLIAYWKLDESAGTIAYDSAGTSHGFFVGYPIWDPANGVHGGCVYFHGDIEKITAPLNCREAAPGAYYEPEIYDDLLDTGPGPFTIACWFKLDGGWTVAYQYILSKNYSFRLYRNSLDGTIRWRTAYGGWRAGSRPVDDDNWWFAACMYDGASRHRLFLAKEGQVGELAAPDSEWFDEGALYPNGTNWAWAIGGINYTGYNYHQRGIVGWMDDVSCWGLELNQDQLQELFLYGAGRVNIPPIVEAGPPLIGHLPDTGQPAQFQLHGRVFDQTLFGPYKLTWWWSKLEGPADVIFEPNEYVLNPLVKMSYEGIYVLALNASDGVYEVNDSVKIDVRPVGWTGEVIKYSFDGDLLDSGADSEIPDLLVAKRYLGINELTQRPQYYEVTPDYAPGIIGQAVHLKDVPLPDAINPILEQPQPDISGTMLQCKHISSDDNFDIALHGFATWTLEAFIKPDPGKTPLMRLLYLCNVDYDDGWITDNIADDANASVWYTVVDVDPYQFGGMFYQSNLHQIYQRYGYEDYGHEVLIPPDEWHHVAVTADGYNITLWVNGFDVWSKPYDGTLNSALYNEDGLRISSVFNNRSYQGLIDEVKINVMPFGADYMKARVLLIPLVLVAPADGFQYAPVNQPLRWKRIKGPLENPQYQVYLGTDPDNLSLAAATGDLYFTPSLNHNTTYYWCVKPIPEGTASEIRSFKTLPAGYETQLARWKFDEGAGAVVNDSAIGLNRKGVDFNYAGVIKGAGDPNWVCGWIAADRKFAGRFSGKALGPGQDAQHNYVEIAPPDAPDVDPNIFKDLPRDRYSLAMWIKAADEGLLHEAAHFLALGDSYGLGRFADSHLARFYAAGICDLQGTSNINNAQWHHIAGVYDKINLMAYLYVDGQLDASAPFAPDAVHALDDCPLLIGSNYHLPHQSFNGAIDDVRIFQHHALSDLEVQFLHEQGYFHRRPVVEAGDYQILAPPSFNTALTGSVINDSLPPADAAASIWTIQEKPLGSMVLIAEPTALTTNVSFNQAGVYTLRLTVDDDAYYPWDQIKIWCQPAPGMSSQILYLRFEADIDPDPLVLKVANEFPNGQPFINIPPPGKQTDPDYAARIDPNVPEFLDDTGQDINPLPLTGAANTGSLGAAAATPAMKGVVDFYPELTFPEDITVEFCAEMGLQSDGDYALLDCRSELGGAEGAYAGFAFYQPNALTVRFHVDDETVLGRHDTVTLQTDIVLADYEIYRFNLPSLPVLVGWKHIAWTYDHKTGISRIFENGRPAFITKVNGIGQPPAYFHDGPDNKRLLMPPVDDALVLPGENPLNQLIIADAGDESAAAVAHNLDELRIHARTLLPRDFLIVAPNYCLGELKSDLNNDCQTDLLDFAVFAAHWLKNTNPYPEK